MLEFLPVLVVGLLELGFLAQLVLAAHLHADDDGIAQHGLGQELVHVVELLELVEELEADGIDLPVEQEAPFAVGIHLAGGFQRLGHHGILVPARLVHEEPDIPPSAAELFILPPEHIGPLRDARLDSRHEGGDLRINSEAPTWNPRPERTARVTLQPFPNCSPKWNPTHNPIIPSTDKNRVNIALHPY